MGRKRSSSSDNDDSSDHVDVERSRNRNQRQRKRNLRSRSRSRSSDSDRSSSRRRKKTSKSTKKSKSRKRSSRSRSQKRRKSDRRSRSRSRSRGDLDKRSRRRRSEESRRNAKGRSTTSPSPPRKRKESSPPPTVPTRQEFENSIKSNNEDNNAISVFKRTKAIEDIESTGFSQSSFQSSAKSKLAGIALPGESSALPSDGFEFGTAVEIAASSADPINTNKVLAEISKEGLCHPNWFGDKEEREKKWIQYLYELRKSLMKK